MAMRKGTVICGRRTLIAAGLVDLVICGWLGREAFRVAGALWTVSDPALAQVLSVCSAEIPKSTLVAADLIRYWFFQM